MIPVVVRISDVPNLRSPRMPLEADRDRALGIMWGEDVEIVSWSAPEDPTELFGALRKLLVSFNGTGKQVQAIEIGVVDSGLVAALAVARQLRILYTRLIAPAYKVGEAAPFEPWQAGFRCHLTDPRLRFFGFSLLTEVTAKGAICRPEEAIASPG